MDETRTPAGDAHTEKLAALYREHPAWRRISTFLDPSATCGVWFRHRPGEAWQLRREGDTTRLEPGRARDPDLVFRFTPASIDALARAGSGVSDFAIRLFELMLEPDERVHVDLRVAAPFARLARRGYLRLLLVGGGPRVVAFAARHGVFGLAAIRRLVASLSRSEPFEWESDTDAASPATPPRRSS